MSGMSLPSTTQVLVVGAGPTGLVSAVTLNQLGLQVVIVDALPAGSHGARAPLIHANTLEVLDTVGLAQPLLKSGMRGTGIKFYGDLNILIDVDIRLLEGKTKFPAILLMAQDQTQVVLEAQLAEAGITVFRNHKAVGMKRAAQGEGMTVSFDNGSFITARYVIGADGPRSTIRSIAGIDFNDPHTGSGYASGVTSPSAMQILLADLRFKEPLPSSIPLNAVSWHLNNQVLLCPLRAPSNPSDANSVEKSPFYWRVGFVVPAGSSPPPRNPDLEFFQNYMDQRKPWTARTTVLSATTTGTYTVRSAIASTLYKKMGGGHILLVGDAAHVHSPAGAQGMNLGLCDAVALGHAVRAHADSRAEGLSEEVSEHPFITYSTSRRKRAKAVMEMARTLTSVINAPRGWRRVLWNAVLWMAGRLLILRRLAAWRLSGLIHRNP